MGPTTDVGQTWWLVELLVPGGVFVVRPIITGRTEAELEADIHASLEELVGMSPMVQQQRPEPPRRLLMAYAAGPAKGMEIAAGLGQLRPEGTLPWDEGTRKAFEEFVKRSMAIE